MKALHWCNFDRIYSRSCHTFSLIACAFYVGRLYFDSAELTLPGLNSTGCRDHAAAVNAAKAKPRLTELYWQLHVNKYIPETITLMPKLIFFSVLTRLPKFHRGKGSRHLGFYVTYFFFFPRRRRHDLVPRFYE